MRVAITGAGGFIGRALIAGMPSEWEVVAVSRGSVAPRDGLVSVEYPQPGELIPPELGQEFDALVHLAGSSSHQLAVDRPWEDLAATGITAAWLLHSIAAKRYVILSSAAVYAGLTGPVGPESRLDPMTAYALSKLYVEGFARSLATRRAAAALVIRLYNAFGPGERPSRLVPRVAAAVRAREPFRLTADPESLSDPLAVDDVVSTLVAGVREDASGVLDLCGGDPRPIVAQVRRIADILGEPLELVEAPDPSETPIRFYSSPAPLQARLKLGAFEGFGPAVRRYAVQARWIRDGDASPDHV